jgi:hypothetical protein
VYVFGTLGFAGKSFCSLSLSAYFSCSLVGSIVVSCLANHGLIFAKLTIFAISIDYSFVVSAVPWLNILTIFYKLSHF